jgi:adenylate kinase family enzyme
MDGTYESTLDLRIPAADCIVLIDNPRWSCIWRVLKRKATVDDERRPDAPAGQKIDRAFLRYIWRYPAVTHPFVLDCIRKYGPDKATVRLRGMSEIQRCLQHVERTRIR